MGDVKLPASNTNIPQAAYAASEQFAETWDSLQDQSYWPVKIFTATQLFIWHLDAFGQDRDPVPMFVDAFARAEGLLRYTLDSGVCLNQFPPNGMTTHGGDFEQEVSGLFSDVWVGMTDDIYFDQSYEFTCERFAKNGLNAHDLFGGALVVDAGCGSGKFSATLARLGAHRVIGVDLGLKGLRFAQEQARKRDYGKRLHYKRGSVLSMPLRDHSVDVVWSNGVIHHTLDYDRCVREFARVLKPGGTLFLYVNGRFGLFELLQDTLRTCMVDVPRNLTQHYLVQLGNNSGRVYWLMDCLYAPYEWRSRDDVKTLLEDNGFGEIRQLMRGVSTDQVEMVSAGLPSAEVKYGEAQLKFLATLS